MNTTRWMAVVLAVGLAAAAVGCSAPALTGPTRIIYESSARQGRKGRTEGIRMVLVHRTNAAHVDKDTGAVTSGDQAAKVVSDALLADMLNRILDAGFNAYAEAMDAGGPALPPGGRSALIVEIGTAARRIATPYEGGGREFAEAYRTMMTEFLEVYQNSTSFHAGGGTEESDKPGWKTTTTFGKDR